MENSFEENRAGLPEPPVVLIPAYEPDEKILRLAEEGLAAGIQRFLVVDDGSSPGCGVWFQKLEALGVPVCRHDKNRGKGEAIKTGLRYILNTWPQCPGVVTADADGQHAVADILRLLQALSECPEGLLLGTRDFSNRDTPFNSRMGNRITSFVFRLLTGKKCPDTQTGLRGIPAALFPMALEAEGSRYEYEMNFLLEAAWQGREIRAIPISTIYLDGNSSSHFRVVRDSFLIYRRPLTFLLVSLLSTAVDFGVFYLVLWLFFAGDPAHAMAATVPARLLSGIINFIGNKVFTFRSHGKALPELLRYLVLFFVMMFLSGNLVALLSVSPVPVLLIKALVDVVLFVCNYLVEHKWVFKAPGSKKQKEE